VTSTESWDGICIPDKLDSGDPKFTQLAEASSLQPVDRIDLTQKCPRVQTQAMDYSCSAQAVVSAIEFLQMKHNDGRYQHWSRLFVYYYARELEKTLGDGGASIKGAISAVRPSRPASSDASRTAAATTSPAAAATKRGGSSPPR